MLRLVLCSFLIGTAFAGSVNTWSGTIQYTEDWGYTTIREGAHSFWWLFAAENADSTRPLFLWLQGGPGSSGIGFGNIEEIGPKDLSEQDRQSTWLQVGDLVFVDNPVGTGFSYVDSDDKYSTNVTQIGADLLNWALDFFAKHPEYQTRPFYIVCESYGGKMTAEFAKQLFFAAKTGLIKVDFRGIGLGDSWISAMDYVNTWGQYLYAQSYLDDQQLAKVNDKAAQCQSLVDNGKWEAATDCWGSMEDVIGTLTNGVSWYNVLKQGNSDDWSSYRETNRIDFRTMKEKLFDRHIKPFQLDALSDYMNTVMRKKFGIIPDNVRFGGQASDVFDYQYGDFMKPNYDTVDSLLDLGLQVIVFNGQLDLICDTIGTEKWINRLKWKSLPQYKSASKVPFGTRNFDLAGYTKGYKNLEMIYILRAGHMVAHDTEESGLFVVKRLVEKTKNAKITA